MKILRYSFLPCLLVSLSLFLLSGCQTKKEKLIEELPRFWTWGGSSEKTDWDTYFTEMTETGITGYIASGGAERLEKLIPIAEKYGVTVFSWTWVMNNGGIAKKHPEWLDYNRKGESLKDSIAYVGHYKFLSPIIPGVRDAIAEHVTEIIKVPGLKGFSMDYCRYVDQILPTSLWGKYGITQHEEHAEWDYGYHPDMLKAFEEQYGYDPSKLEDPTKDSVWFQFRLDKINDVADMISDIAHENGIISSASPFPTPEMSRRMVRQDWGKWNLDVSFPMIYHGFYNGGAQWVADCVRECVEQMPETVIYCGLHIPDFNKATERGKPTLTEVLTAGKAAGAEGFAFYTFNAMSPELRAELKQFIATQPFNK